jgi:hypothetical protein
MTHSKDQLLLSYYSKFYFTIFFKIIQIILYFYNRYPYFYGLQPISRGLTPRIPSRHAESRG